MFNSHTFHSPDKTIELFEIEIEENETKLNVAKQRRQALLDGTGKPRSFSRTAPGQRETVDAAVLEIGGYITNIELTLRRLNVQLAHLKKKGDSKTEASSDTHKALSGYKTLQSMKVFTRFENTALVIAEESQYLIMLVWLQFAQGEKYREIMKAAIQAIKQQNANKLLIDARKHKVLEQKDAIWTKTYFAPDAYHAGLQYLAIVLHDSYILQTSANLLDEQIRNEASSRQSDIFTMQPFTSFETALSWILGQEDRPQNSRTSEPSK
jgi:hypothetical protein